MKYRLRVILCLFAVSAGISFLQAQEKTVSGYLPDGITYVDILIAENGMIKNLRKSVDHDPGDARIYISPGLIDTQVNGYASVSFNREGLTPEKIGQLAEAMWAEGVTTFFPTIITNSPDLIRKNLEILNKTTDNDRELAHTMPGFFMEGPYISPIDGFRGAHQKEWVRAPDWDEFMTFYRASGGKIIQIGLAPETEGAMEFMRKCRELGVGIALAHHNGSASQIEQAVWQGAKVSTHLGNGCANMIHRHDNPLWPQMANDALTPSIIADGHHLRKEELKVFLKVKGPGNLMLVSDATELAGMPAGTYKWNGKEVVMTEDGMLKYPAQNVLAGASFPIRTGVKNMIKLAGCSLDEALEMATYTPAKVYGLTGRGSLMIGAYADLILFTIENDELVIQKTYLKGREVFNKR